jgi:SAM-dependent methyltransferase
MVRFSNPLKNVAYTFYRWLTPVVDPLKMASAFSAYGRYASGWFRYRRMPGAEKMRFIDTAPQLGDLMSLTPVPRHYFHQNLWAFRKIHESGVADHVDVGSSITFVGFLTAICRTTFVDIRPLIVELPNYLSVEGSILALPFPANSVASLSCLHVAEHIGLGRYGDPLDPFGTRKACNELARILAPGGSLYFSCPIGVPRLCFNAHRIHDSRMILEYFAGLRLVELSGIDDANSFVPYIDREILDRSNYACGLFRFTKD